MTVWTQTCTSFCAVHCSPAPRKLRIFSKSSPVVTDSPPSDAETVEIKDTIGMAEADILVLGREIAQLQQTLHHLQSQHKELTDFVESRRCIISIARWLPTDILVEIFVHYLGMEQSNWPPTAPPRNISPLAAICRQWRSVVLTTPLLSRYVWAYANEERNVTFSNIRLRVSLQLQQSAPAPLSLNLFPPFSWIPARRNEIANLLLAESRRWQDAHLSANTLRNQFEHINPVFPALKRLSLDFARSLHTDFPPLIVGPFPALEELHLQTSRESLPCTIQIPWAQLHTCKLSMCKLEDILRVLPLFSPGTGLFLHKMSWLVKPAVQPIHSEIRLLQFTECVALGMAQLFATLTAPSLTRLGFSRSEWSSESLISPITLFLARSSSKLTHLITGVHEFADPIPASALLLLLNSPFICDIFDLDIDFKRYKNVKPIMEALKTSGIIPNLRALALRSWYEVQQDVEEDLLAVCVSRRLTLQSLWLESCPNTSLVSETVQSLKACGVEIVYFHG